MANFFMQWQIWIDFTKRYIPVIWIRVLFFLQKRQKGRDNIIGLVVNSPKEFLTAAQRRRQERTHVLKWRKGESEWGWWKLLWLGRRLGKCSCYDVKLSANGCTIRSTSTKVTKQQLFTAKWSIVKTCSIHCDSFCFLYLSCLVWAIFRKFVSGQCITKCNLIFKLDW